MEQMDKESVVTYNEVMYGLKKESYQENSAYADSSTRIAAWRALARIKGMERTVMDGEVKIGGGVMVVPGLTTEEWKKAAIESQAQLKKEVRK
jgi:hypothetical protein